MTSRYLIGIDFGTTNCTLAYAELNNENPEIKQFSIPQIVSSGVQDSEQMLPSFVYFPLTEEVNNRVCDLSWGQNHHYCVGKFARDRGAELPGRLIWSAKSWLCQSGIDRRAPLLPFETDEKEIKISPVKACVDLLSHLKNAWDNQHTEAPLTEQQVLITVPASFDPNARQLILEAAEEAGYPQVILLEEPQAAFYSWLYALSGSWRNNLKVGDRVLVIDIGGGTTDFSLISVADEKGDLKLERTAVGSHLLLGGDNIDLALAYHVKEQLEDQGHQIDDWQLHAITHACRKAKELLLGENPPESADIAVMGRGSRLIGGLLTYTLKKEHVQKLLLDGFMPLVNVDEQSQLEKRSGIQQMGLSFAQDPRITCQLAKFLSQTGESETCSTDRFIMPTAVLFNGGSTKALAMRERLLEQLQRWSKDLNSAPVKEMPMANHDFAVSCGAVYYGLARRGNGIRIKSGTSRSYFVGVEDAVPAVPGVSKPLKAVCVVPFGMEEGTECDLKGQEFALVLGEPTRFRFFSHSTPQLPDGRIPVVGDQVRRWKQELTELHPIETAMDKTEEDGRVIAIQLKSKITELGVLELWCQSADGRKWKLEFDIRN